MFNKIRIRLTVLNAAVFFVILACFGAVVYYELRHQLYAKVDDSLQTRVQNIGSVNIKSQFFDSTEPMNDPAMNDDKGSDKRRMFLVQGVDPRVFLLLWDEHGNSIPLKAGTEIDKAAVAFKPYRSIQTPETIKVDGHYYRMYTVNYEKPLVMNVRILSDISLSMESGTIMPYPSIIEESASIVSVQAIGIVDSEQNMLRILLELMLFGIFGGGAVTMLAGLYLANQALLPIRRSWDRQQQFVADASHELRMPLAVIQANAELVFRHPDHSILQMSEPLSMVLAESKRMGRLTSQLLTLARADSNQEEMMLKPLSLDTVIREAMQKFEPLAELKRQKLEMNLENGLEMTGDSERLHQLVVILLDNSMKFTPEKGMIRVLACRNGQHIEVVVEDTGIGIPAEDLPHIFDRFYRGDKARTRSSGGTGLGLAIAKWIATKHGGDITVASAIGQGTTVTLRLPAKQRK
ncbi:sensor histidine kinase [Paenibacillus piri]|uniref:histidine kinase n=1 Tax=Paenibacillus piri TaxID=2547395 RepID=A0A4R5KK91_9BACL|nr:HAMP domain-containing sensor histidine kinase [Paenibacillus piri]TDF94770.1 sensor histidine kinase [Paenibacillus piri]